TDLEGESGCSHSFFGHRFVKIEQRARRYRIGGEFGKVDVHIGKFFSDRKQRDRIVRVAFVIINSAQHSRKEYFQLLLRWASCKKQRKTVSDSALRCRASFANHSLGKHAGGFDKRFVVQKRERLQRRVGACPLDAAGFARGHVERSHFGRSRRAFPNGVKTA